MHASTAVLRHGRRFALGLGAAVACAATPDGDATPPSRWIAEHRDEGVPAPTERTPPSTSAPQTAALGDYTALRALPLAELKAALERAGWPAAHVRGFVEAEIQSRLNPPRPPTAAELRPFEFWRTGPDAEPLSPATLRAREQERERREAAVRAACEALLPATGEDDSPALAAWNEQREWGGLDAEKRSRVAAILAETARARDALLQPRGGQLTADEWKTVQGLAAKQRAALEAALSPEELLDHDLRVSPTANAMRHELDAFAPTRAEFLAVFRLRHAHDLKFGSVPRGFVAELDAARPVAEAGLTRALAAALGPPRFADYQLSLQPACQLLRFDGRFAGADAATVRRLYRSLLAAQERLRALPAASAPGAADLKAALFREFRAVLDEEAARRYLQEQGVWP